MENFCRLFLLFLFSNWKFLLSLCYRSSTTEHKLYYNCYIYHLTVKFLDPKATYSNRIERNNPEILDLKLDAVLKWVFELSSFAGGHRVNALEVVSEKFAVSRVRAFFSRLCMCGRTCTHTGEIIVNLLVMLAQHPLSLPTVTLQSFSDLSPQDSDHVTDHTSYFQGQQLVPDPDLAY